MKWDVPVESPKWSICSMMTSSNGNIFRVTGDFPSQRPVTRSFDVFFHLRPKKNGSVDNRKAFDLRRHHVHYDVTVMRCGASTYCDRDKIWNAVFFNKKAWILLVRECWDYIYRILQYDYDDVIMGAIAPQITSLTIVYSTVYSGVNQSKHQSSASLAFVWGIHRGPVNSPHKWPVTRKIFPFDDVIMTKY